MKKNEYIIPSFSGNYSIRFSVVVVICLYYRDTVDQYIEYIRQIPDEIDCLIVSSDDEILYKIEDENLGLNIKTLKKRNRGRDVSALLVAAREEILKYELFCFIHDKKAHYEVLKKDTDLWTHAMWDNLIGTCEMVKSNIHVFDDDSIGLLCPPEVCGELIPQWYTETWGDDFENTVNIAKKLGLERFPTIDEFPKAISTAFWARTKAMTKLFEIDWKYEDFPEEPLPYGGTISHAVEKVIGYVVEDAGYKVRTVITCENAQNILGWAQETLYSTYQYLLEQNGIWNCYHFKHLKEQEKRIKEYIDKHDRNYIFGAGKRGKSLLAFISRIDEKVDGFVVSDDQCMDHNVCGLDVINISKVCGVDKENTGILIGVGMDYLKDVKDTLSALGIDDYLYGFPEYELME